MEQQMQALVQTIGELQAGLQQARQEAADARVAAEAAAAGTGTRRSDGDRLATELKTIGKPEQFDGVKPPWRDWSVVFKAFTGATNPDMAEAMRDAVRSQSPVLCSVLASADLVALSRQLGYWLIQTCRGQALDVVLNAGELEGLEAWRQLYMRFEPQAVSRYAGQLMGLLSWDFGGDLMVRLEAFEREISLYESSSGEVLTPAMRIGIILR